MILKPREGEVSVRRQDRVTQSYIDVQTTQTFWSRLRDLSLNIGITISIAQRDAACTPTRVLRWRTWRSSLFLNVLIVLQWTTRGESLFHSRATTLVKKNLVQLEFWIHLHSWSQQVFKNTRSVSPEGGASEESIQKDIEAFCVRFTAHGGDHFGCRTANTV